MGFFSYLYALMSRSTPDPDCLLFETIGPEPEHFEYRDIEVVDIQTESLSITTPTQNFDQIPPLEHECYYQIHRQRSHTPILATCQSTATTAQRHF